MTPWEIQAVELANCNCSYGCPCQFDALPTHGNCHAAVAFHIVEGHHGDVSLGGLRAAGIYRWPGPVHGGGGEMQLIIDERASPAQRLALERILTGEDTAEMATMWFIFHAMAPHRHETLYRRIDMDVDVDAREGHIAIEGIFTTLAEPIRNPVTGAKHRVRIDLPDGFEYTLAEIGSASTQSAGAIKLPGLTNSYAQFARIHLNNRGIVRKAA